MIARVGIVGLGKMGQSHARVLTQLDSVQLVGFYDPNPRRHDLPNQFFSSVEELSSEVDYMVISSTTSSHVENALFAASQGVACLIEKPLAGTQEDAERIRQAFENNNTLAAVGMVERFNIAASTARTLLSTGEIGEIQHISTNREGPYTGRISDVGVGLDLATHDLDLIQWMTGKRIASTSLERKSLDGGVEDFLVAIGKTEEQISFNSFVNWRSPVKNRQIRVYGESGVMEINLLEMTIKIEKLGNKTVAWEGMKQRFGEAVGDSLLLGLEKQEPLLLQHIEFREFFVTGQSSILCSLAEASSIVGLLE